MPPVETPTRVRRHLPTAHAADLLHRTRELIRQEVLPQAAAGEAAGVFPRDTFRRLSAAGLLGLPYPAAYGGGGQPYEVYLQVLEELAAARLTVGLGVSVHTLSCHALADFGTERQRAAHLPAMLRGGLLGAYCLSEPAAGSDAAALRTRAVREGGHWVLDGTKAWITHGPVADFFTVFARTGGAGPHGISAFLVPADAPGVSVATPERKMGMHGSPTAQVYFEHVRIPDERRLGEENGGFGIAMAALDAGRLGIAACAVGVAQAALDTVVAHTTRPGAGGERPADQQGLRFMLADMATRIEAARTLYLSAARLRDAGLPFSREAAMAKLFCTDTVMRVTDDAVQLLGQEGWSPSLPAERYLREAKVLQIVEGTNQIQRSVIARHLLGRERRGAARPAPPRVPAGVTAEAVPGPRTR